MGQEEPDPHAVHAPPSVFPRDHNLGSRRSMATLHFNYRELKMAEFEGDNFKRPGRQHKDILEAVTSSRRKSVGHPAQKQ